MTYRPAPIAKQLMSVLDTINQSGAGKVFFAGQGTKKDWSMKREHLSPPTQHAGTSYRE